ncbi:EF hand family protein [Tritrichomonas foetus]|uniref:EF hand family protein n=1 Tax=Tritrichomonas foetus TaxID=1144522 RepID=A0A1J4KQM8_9EUKA|nr:EF hand family protein [Tritrichomonas foetus]|eukprot:OHT13232.1 EF hand family protein [Tritrichomonas foetus]
MFIIEKIHNYHSKNCMIIIFNALYRNKSKLKQNLEMQSSIISARSSLTSIASRDSFSNPSEPNDENIENANSPQPNQKIKYNSKKFLIDLRKAFEDADVEGKGGLTLEQWMSSPIRNYLQNGKMSDDQYEKYFRRIDANSDMFLTWKELVVYLIHEITTRDLHISNETTRFITKVDTITPPRSQMHRDMIKHVVTIKRTGEYATLSADSIRFWKPFDLQLKQAILEPGYFADFIILENPFIMIVATTQRRLVFYELDYFTILPVELSASPSTKIIKSMNMTQAQNALKTLGSPNMPLFNVPTSICEAVFENQSDNHIVYFFVGDDQGIIEVFKLSIPFRRKGTDFTVERCSRKSIHDDSINQISPIDNMYCYASCASDNTVKFWQYDDAVFTILRVFTDTIPISGFLFSTTQKVLVTYGASRDAFVWSISPPRKMFKLGDHYNQIQGITDFITTSKEKYLLTMTNRKEFRVWDSVNYRAVHEWSDPTNQRPENHYSCATFDYERHALITCSSYPSKWAEDFTTNVSQYEMLTHNYSIVGCFYASAFDQVLTVDAIQTFKLWDQEKGCLETEHKIPWDRGYSQVSSSCLDNSTRRLVTATFKGDITLYNFNSGQEITRFSTGNQSLISLVYCATINHRDCLIVCRWDKTILAYNETTTCNYELFRSFSGHKSDITAVTNSIFGLVSGGANGEIFAWSADTTIPLSISNLTTPETSVESIICEGQYVIVGDSKGYISIFTLPKLTLISVEQSHGIARPYSLTSMALDKENHYLYTADTFGYIKKWIVKFEETLKLEPVNIYRCHNDEILFLLLIKNGKVILTTSSDRTVRVWRTDDFGYYGFLHNENHWNSLDDDSQIQPSPCEIYQPHFTSPETTRIMPARSAFRKKSNNPNISTTNVSNSNAVVLKDEEKPEDQSFDFNKFNETMDDFMSDKNGSKFIHSQALEILHRPDNNNVSYASIRPSMQLQTTMRPMDIINQFDSLYSTISNQPVSQSTTRFTGMRITKIPNRSYRKGSKGAHTTFEGNRLPLTLQLM